jgi:dihydrolipoamide dehydrogenase
LNVGCIPTKTLLSSSQLFHVAHKGFKGHGIKAPGGVEMDVDELMKEKEKVVEGLTGGVAHLFKKNKVDYVQGWGTFKTTSSLTVALNDGGETTVEAKNIIIATGSEVQPHKACVIDNEKFKIVDSTGGLSLPEVPKHLAVIGGGIIALELGSVWRRLGAEVTFITRRTAARMMDGECANAFLRTLKKEKCKFMTNTSVIASEATEDGVKLTVEPSEYAKKAGEPKEMDVDVVLVATGRIPYTRGLGCEEVGVKVNEWGQVDINDNFETNVPGIYAIGDCVRGEMLAHKASDEGMALAEHLAGGHGHVNYDAIPSVMYTHPEVAWVGKSEEQLKAEGIEYNKGSFPFSAKGWVGGGRVNECVSG